MTTEKPAAGATGPARKTRRRATSARPARRAAGARSAARHARCAQCSRPLTDPESVRLGYRLRGEAGARCEAQAAPTQAVEHEAAPHAETNG